MTSRVLWARIRGAHLPVERDGRVFHERLAELSGLGAVEARALEREYRRFLYLAVVTESACVPPPLVHLAWGYHASLDGYGEDFCRWVLGRSIGPESVAADSSAPAYAATWQAYFAEFGVAPPARFWPMPTAHGQVFYAAAAMTAKMPAPRAHARGWA